MDMTGDFDPNSIEVPNGHFIGGRLLPGGKERIIVRRPSDGQAYQELPIASAEEVSQAVENAEAVFRNSDWARRAPRERAVVLRRWADLMVEEGEALGALEALGSTRPISQAISGDVGLGAEAIRFFAEYADKLGGEVAATKSDNLGLIISEPYGVVAAIAPWNFQIAMAAWKVGPALAAGNAVVLKPSEMTPFSAVRMAQLALKAGVPAGIFNVVQGSGAVTGDALCRHPLVGKISFTGSTRTGAAIMAASAASGTKPVTLELGGKSPQLVFDDIADIDVTARMVMRGILSNAGQVCVAGSRLLVQRRVQDEFVARLVEQFGDIVPGPTWSAASSYSPIISGPQAARIDDIVQRSLRTGAEILKGGGELARHGEGIFYAPTILAGVNHQTPAVREEIFGPVLTVQSFETEEEGIAMAAHPTYGLAAGVHGGEIGRVLRAVRAIKAGTIWVNRYGRSADFILPTGGFGGSGIGKDLGRQAVEAQLRHKAVLIDFARV